MDQFYIEIRQVHIAAAFASGALFFLRGLALFGGHSLALSATVRYLSMAIDTTLLTAALMLMTIVHQYPFADAWLTMKVLLVVLYIALGFVAFWKATTRRAQLGAWIAALATFGFIVSIAHSHSPLGIFAG